MFKELPPNPYVVGPPVSGGIFFGRQDIFESLQETLAGEYRVVVLHGQHRIGKTSILEELYRNSLPEENYCQIGVIKIRTQAHEPFNEVVCAWAAEIAECLNLPEPDPADYQADNDYFVQKFLPNAAARLADRRLILMVDEFHALAGTNTPPSIRQMRDRILPLLQKIVDDERLRSIILLLVMGHDVKNLPPDFRQLIRPARAYQIENFNSEEAAALIQSLAGDALTFEPSALDRIYHYTAGHPCFTQLLGYELFDEAQHHPHPIKAKDVDRIIDRALDTTGQTTFEWLWDSLSLAEQLLISAIGAAAADSIIDKNDMAQVLTQYRLHPFKNLADDINRLVEQQFLHSEGESKYRFEVELLRRWIRRKHPLDREKRNITKISQAAIDYYEKARSNYNKKGEEGEGGDVNIAIERYKLALDENPNFFDAQLELAQVLYAQKNYSEAVTAFENAYWLDEEKSRGGLIEARMTLAQNLEEQGNYLEAAVHYQRICDLDPNYCLLQEKLRELYQQGERAWRQQHWAEAAQFFERLLDIDPAYPDAQQKYLESLYIQGRVAETGRDWAKAAQIFSNVTKNNRDYKDAVKRYYVCRKMQTSPNASYRLTKIQVALGLYKKNEV